MIRISALATAVFAGLALPAQADIAVVAVDPDFAHTAAALQRLFSEHSGHRIELAVTPAPLLALASADVMLAPDADLPARLAMAGQADPGSLFTYAMGAAGTEAATHPRDAALLASGADNAAARAFLDFLLTPEAWDVIVSHGFGAQ